MNRKPHNMKRTKNVQYGLISLILIFLILIMILFAVLSFTNAQADYKLSKKLMTHTSSYYQASNLANEQLAEIDQSLLELYRSCSSQEEYLLKSEEFSSFRIPVNEYQVLSVRLEPLYPSDNNDPLFQIISWNLETLEDFVLDQSLPVLK